MYGDIIKYLRESNNLTQEEFSKLIGVSRSALANYERNFREPDYDILIRIATYFKVTTDYILGIDICLNEKQKLILEAIKRINEEDIKKLIDISKTLYPQAFMNDNLQDNLQK